MTEIAIRPGAPIGASITAALIELEVARDGLIAAKRTRSPDLIVHARRRVQTAVDRARDEHIEWGEIGLALGMARGNAYQRYRIRSRCG